METENYPWNLPKEREVIAIHYHILLIVYRCISNSNNIEINKKIN